MIFDPSEDFRKKVPVLAQPAIEQRLGIAPVSPSIQGCTAPESVFKTKAEQTRMIYDP